MNEDDKVMLAAMEAGVPWWMAREAVASTRLDRDQTHSLGSGGVEEPVEGGA
jgi:hypothetical protein